MKKTLAIILALIIFGSYIDNNEVSASEDELPEMTNISSSKHLE